MGDPPSKAPSDHVILNYEVVVRSPFLVSKIGASGTVALTASPPIDEAGPSPIELKAITLATTASP